MTRSVQRTSGRPVRAGRVVEVLAGESVSAIKAASHQYLSVGQQGCCRCIATAAGRRNWQPLAIGGVIERGARELISIVVDAPGEQHLAIGQQGRRSSDADAVAPAAIGPGASDRIVQLGAGEIVYA